MRCCPISSFHEFIDFSSSSRKASTIRNQELSPTFKQYKTVISDEKVLQWLVDIGFSEPTKLHKELLLNACDGKSYVLLSAAGSGKRSLGVISALKMSSSLGDTGASNRNLFLFDDAERLSGFKSYLSGLSLEEPFAQADDFATFAIDAIDPNEYSMIFLDVADASSLESHAEILEKLLAANSQVLLSGVTDSPKLRSLIAVGNPDVEFYSAESQALVRERVQKETVVGCLNAEKAAGLLVCLKDTAEQGKSSVVYCNHHSDARNLADALSKRGVNAVAHTFSNKPRSFHKLHKATATGEPIVIIGTDASLKGFFSSAVSQLVHYDVAESSLFHVARYAQFDVMEQPYETVLFVCDESGVNLLSVNESLGKEWSIDATQPVAEAFPLGDIEAFSIPSRAERKAEAKRRRQEEKRNGGRGGRGGPRGGRNDKDRPDRKPRSQEGKPSDGAPAADKPRSDRPMSDKPGSDRPRSDKPRADRPRSDKPRGDRPDSRPRRSDDDSRNARPGRRRRGLQRDDKPKAAASPRSSDSSNASSQKGSGKRRGKPNARPHSKPYGKPRSNGLRKPVNPSIAVKSTTPSQKPSGLLSKVGSKIKKFFTFS